MRFSSAKYLWALWLMLPSFAQGDHEPLSRLGIPPSVASVTSRSGHVPESLPRYVIIQDLHDHPEAQSAITAIILYGTHAWNLRHVYVEGASGDLSRAQLNPSNSGAERAAVMEPGLRLIGIEDWPVYVDNLEAYTGTLEVQRAALRELEAIRVLGRSMDVEGQGTRWDVVEQMIRLTLRPQEFSPELSKIPLPRSPSLAEAMRRASRFYDLADQRSHIFFKNLAASQTGGTNVVVVGGFHTPQLTDLLRTTGESYVVLTPKITHTGDESRYQRRMIESLSALKQRAISH